MDHQEHAVIEARILALTGARGPEKSVCPSEIARDLASAEWRSLLGPVRDAAVRLVQTGQIEVLRKGKPVDAAAVRGVIRLRAKERR